MEKSKIFREEEEESDDVYDDDRYYVYWTVRRVLRKLRKRLVVKLVKLFVVGPVPTALACARVG